MRNRQQVTLLSTLLTAALVALGIGVLIKFLLSRQSRIEATQNKIVELLGQLDPIARMQVAQHVVEAELDKLPVKSTSEA